MISELNDDGTPCGRGVGAIRDTTSNGQLKVLSDGQEIGRAIKMSLIEHEGHPAILYNCRVYQTNPKLKRTKEGWFIAKHCIAAGSPTGIYPTALELS